jgi:hypothetical protein
MPHGRKPKLKQNTSGLRNQKKPATPSPILLPARHTTPAEISDGDSDLDSDSAWSAYLKFDSMKTSIEMEDSDEEDVEPSEDLEDLEGWDNWEVGKDGFYVNLMRFAIDQGDDP